ncbi:hypothetical protein [Planomonospora sp. ID82291]|uniref:hypothetical protein n=1 Tax=Planomonospora sp. ID82291 TaxID=2738136 RepID=UPI0018C4319D|nr:hypothetical protein [Planomonospora sp. ID82291]MBG0814840.1 hypothetical protein [Planomonospora sp. ID82291]
MKRLVPYPILAGDVSLDVREVRLDDVALPFAMVSKQELVVALHAVERDEWESARLSVRLRTPQDLKTGPWSNPSCFAVLSERRTNMRTSSRLREETPGNWTGEVVLHRDHHRGQVELTAHVVGSVEGIAGRVIGTANERWTVDLQARAPVKKKSIKTVWADFRDERNPHLHPFREDPWTVEAVGEEPVLYLNMGFEGLDALLKSTRSAERAARDAIAAQIAADVWAALFNAAVYTAEIEDGRPEWPGGWHESVLRRMLPDVFPDLSPDDALVEIVNRRHAGDGGGDLQTRLLHAAAKQSRLPRNLGGFIRTLRRTGQEDE